MRYYRLFASLTDVDNRVWTLLNRSQACSGKYYTWKERDRDTFLEVHVWISLSEENVRLPVAASLKFMHKAVAPGEFSTSCITSTYRRRSSHMAMGIRRSNMQPILCSLKGILSLSYFRSVWQFFSTNFFFCVFFFVWNNFLLPGNSRWSFKIDSSITNDLCIFRNLFNAMNGSIRYISCARMTVWIMQNRYQRIILGMDYNWINNGSSNDTKFAHRISIIINCQHVVHCFDDVTFPRVSFK